MIKYTLKLPFNNIQTIVISESEATFNFKIDSVRNQKAEDTFFYIS